MQLSQAVSCDKCSSFGSEVSGGHRQRQLQVGLLHGLQHCSSKESPEVQDWETSRSRCTLSTVGGCMGSQKTHSQAPFLSAQGQNSCPVQQGGRAVGILGGLCLPARDLLR